MEILKEKIRNDLVTIDTLMRQMVDDKFFKPEDYEKAKIETWEVASKLLEKNLSVCISQDTNETIDELRNSNNILREKVKGLVS